MARIVKKLAEGIEYLVVTANAAPTLFTIGELASNNAELTVNGNLTVRGTSSTIHSTDTLIDDNFITLNAGVTGVPSLDSGIEVERGTSPNVSIQWNETVDRWQMTNDGSTFGNIATIGAGSSYIENIVEDITPQLGGNLDVNGKTITSVGATNVIINPDVNLQLEKVLQIKEITAPGANVAGYGLVHGNVVGGGGTGIYVTHESEITQELISKKKALAFSIILG
jgi:hypothetical protein